MFSFELRFARSAAATRVVVGCGALRRLVEEGVPATGARKVVVVSDSNVAPLYGEPLSKSLGSRGFEAHLLSFLAGEKSKTRETKAALEDRLFQIGADRNTLILAVGGGVTGDLAGFLAATWHRGVPLVQVPTSLLAMADAALGGKTGVNLPGGKNLVGAFYQPGAVYADPDTLGTLPEERLADGFAEIVKAATIGDRSLFTLLERQADCLLRRDLSALERAVAGSLRIKARIVRRDEREAGSRAALNFGHTIGHALEAVCGFELAHGRAVAIGMALEARIASRVTGLPERHVERIRSLLERLGLSTDWPRGVSAEAVLERTFRDKKVRDGRVRYALPARIGRMPRTAAATVEVSERIVREVLETHPREG
jgi:3-dehydroquinate synthase